MRKQKQQKLTLLLPIYRIVIIRAKAIFIILLALDAMHYALDDRSPLTPAWSTPIALIIDSTILYLAARWLLRTTRPDDPCFTNTLSRTHILNLISPALASAILFVATSIFAPSPLLIGHAHHQHAHHPHHVHHGTQ